MVEQESSGNTSAQKYATDKQTTWNKSDFSVSSNTLIDEMASYSERADLLQLLQILKKIHPEYGAGTSTHAQSTGLNPYEKLIGFLQEKKHLLSLTRFSHDDWALEVLSIITKPKKPPVIRGRMFLIAVVLSRFSEVFTQLKKDSEWQKICLSVIEQMDQELTDKEIIYRSLLTKKGNELLDSVTNAFEKDSQDMPEDSLMYTGNLSDVPTKEDSLSRKALAKYLVKRLRHIYNRDIDKGKYGSFFMHIDGEWGSGKSTLLRFMEDELQQEVAASAEIDPQQKSQREWIVVTFNAWENQRLDPPWWFLMSGVYREAMKKIRKNNWRKWISVGLNEFLWRFNAGNNYLKAAVLTFLIFGGALLLKVKSVPDFQGLPIVQIITLLGFIWSFSKLISSSLLPGSARAAHSFIEENGKDPMNALANHFEKLIERIGSPVAIFVDDLDRCNRDYGIRLLEGLQTIFKRAPVIYVIAADRKWLKIMYEDQYSMFAPALAKPAKPFGLVFLDKIFQLVVELPDISAIQKRIYWNKLLNISSPDEPRVTEVEVNEIKRKVESAPHNSDKMDIANRTEGSMEKKQIAREQAISAVSIREEEKILEHKLQDFIDLIEPNPRAMKRLINDVSTAKAVTYLYDQNIDADQLILWTILKQEYPSLAEFFWNNPEKINEALSYTDITKPFTNNKEHDELLGREEIKNLFQYSMNGRKLKLDNEFLEKMKFKDRITLLPNAFESPKRDFSQSH